MEKLAAELDMLGREAEVLCRRHLEFALSGNKSRHWDGKSRLYVKSRIRGYGLEANWYEIRWYGKKEAGTRRMSKKMLKKPSRGHAYNLGTLSRHAQPWEMDVVMDVEQALSKIRQKAGLLSKARAYLARYERLEGSDE